MSSPTFTYTPNVPQAAQKISSTQLPIMNNFQAINELISVNHVGFSDSVNFGKHIYTSFPAQGSDPSTSSTEIALYSKTASTSNGIELYYRYPSNGTVVQLSGGGSTGVSATNGASYLTSTLLMKWGNATINATGTTVVTFPTSGGLPAFGTSVYVINFAPSGNYTLSNTGGWVSNITTTSFTFNAPAGGMSTTIYWSAMGI